MKARHIKPARTSGQPKLVGTMSRHRPFSFTKIHKNKITRIDRSSINCQIDPFWVSSFTTVSPRANTAVENITKKIARLLGIINERIVENENLVTKKTTQPTQNDNEHGLLAILFIILKQSLEINFSALKQVYLTKIRTLFTQTRELA